MATAALILGAAGAYTGLGFIFAIAFAVWGAATIDDAARGTPLSFRLLIIPAAAALWPLLAIRWLQVWRRRSVA